MRKVRLNLMTCMLLATAACSYDGIRMNERFRCSRMPQTESERCYSKTQMTKAEYDTARSKVAGSGAREVEQEQPVDPRYKEWIP